MNEFELIGSIFAPLAGEGAFGLTDDAAIIPSRPGFDLVVTTDAIAEGTDFFAFDPADTIARKSLRVNLSDLAAKGAVPHGYLLNIALPPSITPDWLAAFAQGLSRDQRDFGIVLLGGDTARTEGPLSIAVTAFGYVPGGGMIRRSGARPGDDVYVTGAIGDSGGGLAIFRRERHALTDDQRDALISRYRVPQPPVSFGAQHLRAFASAAVDVSDGLLADLGHVAGASGVKLVVDADAIPRSAPLRAFWGDEDTAIIRAATAGDDYQIAFTAPPEQRTSIAAVGGASRIGQVVVGQGIDLMRKGRLLPVGQKGFVHF